MKEYWTEVNLVLKESPDEDLLCGKVHPLVKETLQEKILIWFFFWEPDLRLRFRWIDLEAKNAGDQVLQSTFDEWKNLGEIQDWFTGNHGRCGEEYAGEAEMYGEEMWPLCQQDWMNGSEMAVSLMQQEKSGTITRNRAYHWSRYVHLFSNQLVNTWSAEVTLCLKQALNYLKLFDRGLEKEDKDLKLMLQKLNDVLDDTDKIESFEKQMQADWEKTGKPDWGKFLSRKEDK